MSFIEKASARKRTRELKAEIKQLRKNLLDAGCDKAVVNAGSKEFLEAVEQGRVLCAEYRLSYMHLKKAQKEIGYLLINMSKIPAEKLTEQLNKLVDHLENSYNDCLISKDDPDFESTVSSLKNVIRENVYTGMPLIMLRSELENIKAMLDDVTERAAPHFLSLGYFVLHMDSSILKDMENGQRNAYVKSCCEEGLEPFLLECQRTGCFEHLERIIEKYIYKHV